MLHDTVAPTMLQAGIRQQRDSVRGARRPSTSACFPGNSIDPLLAKLQQLVNDPRSGSRSSRPGRSGSVLVTHSDLYNTISPCRRQAVSRRACRTDHVHLLHGFHSAALRTCRPTACFPFRSPTRICPACTPITNASRSILFAKASNFSIGIVSDFCGEPNDMIIPRRAKIVCTLGPASSSYKMIEKLVRAGMDVARLNFSHGTHAEHEQAHRRRSPCFRPLSKSRSAFSPTCRARKSAPASWSDGKPVRLRFGQRFTITTATSRHRRGVSTTFRALARVRA